MAAEPSSERRWRFLCGPMVLKRENGVAKRMLDFAVAEDFSKISVHRKSYRV
jgi:hypothetical protein